VLLGFLAARGTWSTVGAAALSIGCYIGGTFVGALLAKPLRREQGTRHPADDSPAGRWPWGLVALHAGELALVALAALAAALWQPREGSDGARLLIAAVAFSVGIQSAAMNAMRIPGIVTTYITGTWTTLAIGVASLVDGEEQGTAREPWERRLLLQGATLLVYCGSACVAGMLFRSHGNRWLGWWPVCLLALAVGGGSLCRRSTMKS
jgi:uncharacterized membrane protein YoaK (UPF0700 family)